MGGKFFVIGELSFCEEEEEEDEEEDRRLSSDLAFSTSSM